MVMLCWFFPWVVLAVNSKCWSCWNHHTVLWKFFSSNLNVVLTILHIFLSAAWLILWLLFSQINLLLCNLFITVFYYLVSFLLGFACVKFLLPAEAMAVLFSASLLSVFSVNTITHKPLHLAWWNFARTSTFRTFRSLLNIKVIGNRS